MVLICNQFSKNALKFKDKVTSSQPVCSALGQNYVPF